MSYARRIIPLVLVLLAGCGAVTTRTTRDRELPRGISAWTYDFTEVTVRQIKAHNAVAPDHRKFRYLFPYAGSVSFGKERTFETTWSGEVTAKFVQALGPDIRMLPIFDGRQDERQFNDWTDAEYEKLAAQVAAHVTADPHAAGIQIDVEPFRPSHLPFYEALGRLLRAEGKLMTGFISPGQSEEVLRRMYAACDIVVLSGYDLELPDPDRYGAGLERFLARCHPFAAAAHALTMVGIPASAAWFEHEYTGTIENGVCVRKESGFTQPQWLSAAAKAVAAHEGDSTHLGVALWHLTGRESGEPGECRRSYQPDFISPECWRIVRTMGR